MQLTYQVFTPGVVWPPLESINWAINSQAGIHARAALQQDQLVIASQDGRIRATATMKPYDPSGYASVKERYQERMTSRDRTTALPFERAVQVSTNGPVSIETALFHAAVGDGLWWLVGGFLADASVSTLWGWRSWRSESSLSQHAADLLASGDLPTIPRPFKPNGAPTAPLPATPGWNTHQSVVVYTLPYCPDCRALKQILDTRGVRYHEIDLAAMPGAVDQMLRLSDGKRSAPTVQIGQQVLVDPEPDALVDSLRRSGLL
jgi:mycoredoxin